MLHQCEMDAVLHFFSFCHLALFVFLPPPPLCLHFHTTGCGVRPTLLRQIDVGSLTCAQLWVRAVHVKVGSGTNKSAQELTRLRGVEKKCPSPCPTRGSNPGSSDLNSKALNAELHPQSCLSELLVSNC